MEMASRGKVGVVLLQETGNRPGDLSHPLRCKDIVFRGRHLYDPWPLVVLLSDRIEVEWFRQVLPISKLAQGDIGVNGIVTIAAARIRATGRSEDVSVAISMYARDMKRRPSTGAR